MEKAVGESRDAVATAPDRLLTESFRRSSVRSRHRTALKKSAEAPNNESRMSKLSLQVSRKRGMYRIRINVHPCLAGSIPP